MRGPLTTRIQHPLALTHPSLVPRSGAVLEPGAWRAGVDLAYSSVYTVDAAANLRVNLDAELARAEWRAAVGLGSGFEAGLAVPIQHAGDGFLDPFLEEFHDFLGLPNSGREFGPVNEFQGAVGLAGTPLYELAQDQLAVADSTLELSWNPRPPAPSRWNVAWRLGLDLPVGDQDKGYGNGALEWAVGVAASRDAGRMTHFAGASFVDVVGADGFQGTPARELDFVEGYWGLEYRWSNASSLLGTLFARSPMVEGVDSDSIEHPVVDLGIGWARDLGGGARFVISFHEDLLAKSGPDFTLRAGIHFGH